MALVYTIVMSCVLTKGVRLQPVTVDDALQPADEPRDKNAANNKRLGNSRFSCLDVSFMLRKTTELSHVISKKMNDIIIEESWPIDKEKDKPDRSTSYEMQALKLYQRELNASEAALYAVLQGLNRTLSSDYKSLDKVKKSCEVRLAAMQEIALEAEENHNGLVSLVADLKHYLGTSNLSSQHHIMNSILSDISHAADRLENRLKDDLFDSLVQSKAQQGAEIETVVRVGGAGVGNYDDDSVVFEQGEAVLVDSLSNHYTLSRPRDTTVLVEDPHLIHDIVVVLILASMLGTACCLMGVPTLFGYCTAGILIGPAGYNVIKVLEREGGVNVSVYFSQWYKLKLLVSLVLCLSSLWLAWNFLWKN